MKFLLVTITLFTSLAFAEDNKKEQNLDEARARISANIDQRISTLQTLKGCVQSAANKDALKTCRKTNKEAMKKLHMENKEERNEMKADKKSEREERKKNKRDKKGKKNNSDD